MFRRWESRAPVKQAIPVEEHPKVQNFVAVPLYALVRFGRWDEIPKAPEPASNLPFFRAVWHYARGTAFAFTGRFAEAEAEAGLFFEAAKDPALAESAPSPGAARVRLIVQSKRRAVPWAGGDQRAGV